MATPLKTNELTKLGEGALASAHQAWLAGLGAVSATREEASDLFARLVERGKKLETRGKKEAGKVRERLTSSVESLGKDLGQAFDQRVAAALARLGVPTRDDIRDLTRRVEELTKSVSRLSAHEPPSGHEPKSRATA